MGSVTPCVGVWIEIRGGKPRSKKKESSLPAWECGLKFCNHIHDKPVPCHSLRGSVD